MNATVLYYYFFSIFQCYPNGTVNHPEGTFSHTSLIMFLGQIPRIAGSKGLCVFSVEYLLLNCSSEREAQCAITQQRMNSCRPALSHYAFCSEITSH